MEMEVVIGRIAVTERNVGRSLVVAISVHICHEVTYFRLERIGKESELILPHKPLSTSYGYTVCQESDSLRHVDS